MSPRARSASTQPEGRHPHPLLEGIWRVADPKITLASVAAMLLGGAAAGHDGPIAWGWLALTVLGIFFVEAAKNASGEVFDWDSGTDQAITDEERTPFSGGKRLLVDGLLTRRQVIMVAGAFYVLGAGCGIAIVLLREPSVIAWGLAGFALAYFYHAPPLRLSYRGLGELAVGVAYGPIIACGTYLVQRHQVSPELALASIPLGVAIAAFLWINEFPDLRADREAGKRTLVVRLGRARAARAFALLIAGTYVTLLALPLAGLPATLWLGVVGLPHGVRAARRLLRHAEEPQKLIAAQAWTLASFVLLSVGMSLGWLWA
ncbi:MAG: prenyltransferase [Myxococcales bacterium]|nr:prenyltransferase [Myxococcales bacterium]